MLRQTTYPTAERAAEQILRYLEGTLAPQTQTAAWPSQAILAVLIDSSFWTSLSREERFTPRISLAFVAPEACASRVSFSNPLPLAPEDLGKLAAAVERSGIHLCVWMEKGELQVWGIVHQLPPLCIVIEIVIPGQLVVKLSPSLDSGKFLNVAVIEADRIMLIDHEAKAAPRDPMIDRLLQQPLDSHGVVGGNVLLRLAISIRAHGHGGLMVMIPEGSDEWKKSVAHPVGYEISPPFRGLADLFQNKQKVDRSREDALTRAIDEVAGLTAVDGAMVVTRDYEIVAFGVKLTRRNQFPHVSEVLVTESVVDVDPSIAEPTRLGGTRHLAAAQFINDQPDAIAIVASQDGRVTVFKWSGKENRVHAHRFDALLL